ncbi:hypothetical protein PR048_006724 [Dryococelus australis]|uniref:Uncharacterized protein n=1 Tax=Dryococelus australis TaxID=614101 RepID=A0ABQ9ICZ7_9NEOP|nr:hypothetical protein PR048_006724 [Dryococelus australis]
MTAKELHVHIIYSLLSSSNITSLSIALTKLGYYIQIAKKYGCARTKIAAINSVFCISTDGSSKSEAKLYLIVVRVYKKFLTKSEIANFLLLH